MSFRSGSVQKKLKDDQFVGDLISLFERRKIKTGDPASLDAFDSALSSNDAFRSQLFTLCTAISHMSAEDLSGEQLLALIARALGGPEVCKNDGTVDVPDSMRSAFLSGYDAWTNRAFEPKEPLPWPAPRQPEAGEDALPTPQATAAEPAAPRTLTPGIHTMQDAIALARERSLADAAARPSSQSDAKIEGLTLSELKALLAEIENRVNRIQPHLNDLNSISRPPADDFGPRDRMRGIDAAFADRHAPLPGIPITPRVDAPAAAFALDAATTQTTHRATRPANIDEAAFLARHAYLRPTRRIVASPTGGLAPTGTAAQPAALSATPSTGPPLAVAPAVPLVVPDPVRAPEQAAADLTQFARVATVPATLVAATPVTSVVLPAPAPIAAPAPDLIVPSAGPYIVPRPRPVPYIPEDERSASLAIGRIRISRHMAVGSLTALAALIVVISGLAGIFIYPSLHPKTINDYPGLKPQAMDTAPADATPAQVIVTEPVDASATAPRPRSANATDSSTRLHSRAPQAPPVNVWPAAGAAPQRDTAAASTPSLPVTLTAHRAPSQAAPLYVPSATLIGYAVSSPQPSYPRDQPRGISGTVVVQITVSRDGNVSDIRVVSGPVEMRPATIQAVQSWRFRPYLVDGSPAEVTTTLGFLFKGQ